MAERKPIRTDADIRTAKPEEAPYRRPVGHGLYLEVRPTGTKLWRYRYRLPGTDGIRHENLFAMGEYGKGGKDRGQFTLAEAEEERGRIRELVRRGIHPAHARRETKQARILTTGNTFKVLALEWIEAKRKVRSDSYIKQIERAFNDVVYPAIGNRPMTAITHAELSDVIDSRAKETPSVAFLIQQWIGSVFRHAMRKGKATADPSYILRGSVVRPPVKSKAPLLKADFPAFAVAMQKHGGNRATKIALELLMLTFVRPGELCGASWAEFNLDGAIWKIPASRMKKGLEHWVPLSSRAVALLRELHDITGDGKWLFPNARNAERHMTTKALNAALERMGYAGKFSAHGFRSTASTALNGLGFRHDAIEVQLAHKERNITRASYNQATYWEIRVDIMERWAAICADWMRGQEADTSNVVTLRAVA